MYIRVPCAKLGPHLKSTNYVIFDGQLQAFALAVWFRLSGFSGLQFDGFAGFFLGFTG